MFEATQRLLQEGEGADDKTFKATLQLPVPQDWNIRSPEAMMAAFGRVHVQRLEVSIPGDSEIPKALCEGVAVLLRSGHLRELVFSGRLADHDVVVNALNECEGPIELLELGRDRRGPLSHREKEGYHALMTSEKAQATLQKLTIRGRDLIPYFVSSGVPQVCWPALNELTVNDADGDDVVMPAFLRYFNHSKLLTQVSLMFECDPPVNSIGPLLGALEAIASLTHVTLGVEIPLLFPTRFDALETAVVFAFSDRRLTHFQWHTGATAHSMAQHMADLKRRSLDLDLRTPSPAIQKAIQTNTTLRSFSMDGFFLREGSMLSMGDGLVGNECLEVLELSGCAHDVVATRALMGSLSKRKMPLKDLALPVDPRAYFWTQPQGDIFLLERNGAKIPSRWDVADLRDDVRLAKDPWGRPLPPLDPGVKKHADTLQLQVLKHLGKPVVREGVLELARNVMQLMASVPGFPFENLDIAESIVRFLHDDGALRSAVSLAAVNKRVGHEPPASDTSQQGPDPMKLSKDTMALVKLSNRAAVQRGLKTAPLRENEVDETGANKALMNAVANKSAAWVRQLLWYGAIDFGGRVARQAPSGILRDLFLPVNRVDKDEVNVALKEAMLAGDAELVLSLRARGARDFGGRVRKMIPPGAETKALREAFAKVASNAAIKTTTTTTTSNTATTTTTGVTTPTQNPRARALRSRQPRDQS